MTLNAMGIAHRHDKDFRIERPCGSGDNLLLIFKSDALLILGEKTLSLSSGTAIVFSKGAPQIYGAAGKEYVNHWVHFNCLETDIFFDRIGLAFNVPITLSDIEEVEAVLEMLSVENISQDASGECTDLLLRLLLARIFRKKPCSATAHSDALQRLRAEIYGNPSGSLSIEGLAKRLHLSPPHFQSLYKAQFGISCYEDVIRARLAAAQYYLKSTSLSVKKISELCGYENDVHFIRQFKSRTGATPTQYRQRAADAGPLIKQ